MKLKNIWPEIIGSQRLEQNHKKNKRYKRNLNNKFRQRKLYLYRGRTAN